MATKKVYRKGKQITSLDEIMNDRHKSTVIYLLAYSKSSIHISYNKLKVMALASVISLIENNNLFYATIVEEEIIRKTKPKSEVEVKQKSNITNCKANLDSIYGET